MIWKMTGISLSKAVGKVTFFITNVEFKANFFCCGSVLLKFTLTLSHKCGYAYSVHVRVVICESSLSLAKIKKGFNFSRSGNFSRN